MEREGGREKKRERERVRLIIARKCEKHIVFFADCRVSWQSSGGLSERWKLGKVKKRQSSDALLICSLYSFRVASGWLPGGCSGTPVGDRARL